MSTAIADAVVRAQAGAHLSIPDAALVYGVHRRSFRRAIAAGDLAAIGTGRLTRVRPSDVMAWMGKTSTTETAEKTADRILRAVK